MTKKKVLLPLADGFEEIEALTVVDVLRRAGVDVVVAGLEKGPRTGRSEITVIPDTTLDAALTADDYDMIVLPGGMPASATLRDDPRVTEAVARMNERGQPIAAICAAPIALNRAGVLGGRQFTSYPGMEPQLPSEGYREDRVVVSEKVITSRGPGTAMEFSLELIRQLLGDDAAKETAREVLAQ